MSDQLTPMGKAVAISLGIGAAVGLSAGLGFGWKFWRPKRVTETQAPAVRQQDGSLVLERKPDADANPAQQIPAGAKAVRVVQVVVQPKAPLLGPSAAVPAPTPGGAQLAGANPVPSTASAPVSAVRVDLTLVRMPDQTQRVIASSPDGTVVGGVDIPTESAVPPKVLKWAAGGVYGVSQSGKSVGVFVDRDAAFLRLGAELTRQTFSTTVAPQWEIRGKVGIRF